MLEGAKSKLLVQVDALIEANFRAELIRGRLDHLAGSTDALSSFENELNARCSDRRNWNVLEHCATLTRAYSILEGFFSSLTREICELLPSIYLHFEDIPEKTRTAYRKGFARILIEIEDKPHLREIDLKRLSETFAEALRNETPYRVEAPPFLANRRALRLPQISGHLKELGIQDVERHLLKSVSLKHLLENREPERTPAQELQSQIDTFINARNDAAHSEISDVWAPERLRQGAYLIRDLCLAVAEIVENQMTELLVRKGVLPLVGCVTELHSNGKGVIFVPKRCLLGVGADIIVANERRVRVSSIRSLRVSDKQLDIFEGDESSELGVLLGLNCSVGDLIYVTADALIPLAVPLPDQPELEFIIEEECLSDEFVDIEPEEQSTG